MQQLLPPVAGATLQSMGNVIPTTAAVTTATVTVTTTTTWQTVNPTLGQQLPTQQQWTQIASAATQTTTILPSAAAGTAAATTFNASTYSVRWPATSDSHFEKCAAREKLWLKKASTKDVQQFANTANCDLRACEQWLLYRDPSVRKLPRSRWLCGWGAVDLG